MMGPGARPSSKLEHKFDVVPFSLRTVQKIGLRAYKRWYFLSHPLAGWLRCFLASSAKARQSSRGQSPKPRTVQQICWSLSLSQLPGATPRLSARNINQATHRGSVFYWYTDIKIKHRNSPHGKTPRPTAAAILQVWSSVTSRKPISKQPGWVCFTALRFQRNIISFQLCSLALVLIQILYIYLYPAGEKYSCADLVQN